MRAAKWVGGFFALHCAALALATAWLPWHLAFDDPFHIQDAQLWSREGLLALYPEQCDRATG